MAGFMRRRGVHTLIFLDDLSWSISALACEWARIRLVFLVMGLNYLAGFYVGLRKSWLSMTCILELLGFIVDSGQQLFRVPEAKLQVILAALRLAAVATVMPLTELQSLCGRLNALAIAVPCVGAFVTASHRAMAEADRLGVSRVKVSQHMSADFKDLLVLQDWTGLSRWGPELHKRVRLDTDASGEGWGCVLYTASGAHTARGRFGPELLSTDIMVKEGAATVLALRELGHLVRGGTVDLYVDNTAVQYTLLKGRLPFEESRAHARELLQWQLATDSVIRVHRVTTEGNYVADRMSRKGYLLPDIGGDFSLGTEVRDRLAKWYGKFTIDVCASHLNHVCPRYIVDPFSEQGGAVGVNVFLHVFAPGEWIYCYPPWALVSPIWRHMKLSGCNGVMILPDDSTKEWFGCVMADACSVARLGFKGVPGLITHRGLDGRVEGVGPASG